MTNAQIIKAAGFKAVKITTAEFKTPFGGKSNHVINLFDAAGNALKYEGTTYSPLGGASAFAALIVSGDIKANCFSF